MKLTQTWGWLTAGVLAAGLNASYHNGGLQWAHRVADRVEEASSMVHALAAGQTGEFLTEARAFLGQDSIQPVTDQQYVATKAETAPCPWATTLARVQTKIARSETRFARVRVMTDREQEALDRAQAEQDRVEARRERLQARMEANRDRLEAQMAEWGVTANLTSVTFNTPEPPACPRIRVNVPRMPRINIPTPEIRINTSADPI